MKMKKNGKEIVIKKKPVKDGVIPRLSKEISHLLSSEEAKVSPRGIVMGTVTLLTLGYTVDALAGHVNQHQNWAPHASYNPHHSVDCGHDSFGVHQNSAPHVNVSPHSSGTYPHTNTHASVNESVTKGTVTNSSADGFGKHTASLSHNNNPNTHTNTSGHNSAVPHFNYGTHSSTAPHVSVGHHVNYAPHHSGAPHLSLHRNGHWNG